mmetsp:Transcript_42337/g.64953  ORF Transcript_42337/g.64953 Transcript_42337/m.64953 type:complete len:85 (-) Transcript_42337:1515-1769(-)
MNFYMPSGTENSKKPLVSRYKINDHIDKSEDASPPQTAGLPIVTSPDGRSSKRGQAPKEKKIASERQDKKSFSYSTNWFQNEIP